jgi:hypothetical protein
MAEPIITTLQECDDVLDARKKMSRDWSGAIGVRDEVAKLSSRLSVQPGAAFSGPLADGEPAKELGAAADLLKGRLAQGDKLIAEVQKKRDEIKTIQFRDNVVMVVVAAAVVIVVALLINAMR